MKKILISIVSHGQLNLVCDLLKDMQYLDFIDIEIILTINIYECEERLSDFLTLPIKIIRNEFPKGFGANHNAAFFLNKCDYFFVVNPDIRLVNFSFLRLIEPFQHSSVAAVGPLVLSPTGVIEDSARRFLTPFRLIKRVFCKNSTLDYQYGTSLINVDWCAGMFMVFSAEAYRLVGGFDERYFMYYEDADICRRFNMLGLLTVLQPNFRVIHDARRSSHRNFRYLFWHVLSIIRFLFFPVKKI